ncbi:MAG TPA: hypothetical protein VG890_07030 [Puia sp.]|nr:hypothetical protein [Puia sp.]
MSSPLENFVRDHRDEFDDDSPSPELWDKIRSRMEAPVKTDEPEGEKAIVRSMPFKRWLSAAAAAVVILAGGWIYYSVHQRTTTGPALAGNQQQQSKPDTGQTVATKPVVDSPSHIQEQLAQVKPDEVKPENQQADNNPTSAEEADYNEEIYHYSRLVEIKHNELKTLQKDEPLLYRQFAGDVDKLDSVYRNLKTQLPKNPNREQLIEAMISNLQLQIGLLNKQLNIIKQIRHSKNQAYEKAYKSV